MSRNVESETQLLDQVLLLPSTAELEIPEDYLDSNGHVNMMYFTLIANLGWKNFFNELGLPRERLVEAKRSTFALRQFITYLSELSEGDKVAVHSGLVNYDNKRLHFIFYIVNNTKHKLASIDERLVIYMDMTTRHAATFEDDVLSHLKQAKLNYANKGWMPELSGAIKIKENKPL